MNDAITALVRRHDPDRFLTALFAPPDRRDALLTLYAFNHEVARAREVASQPPLALIRLQWWREVVEGQAKRHEVATPLTEVIRAGVLDPALLLPVIEARETEVYADFETTEAWRDWLAAGAGGLAVAAAAALGAPMPEAARLFGAAYGAAGLLRSTGALASRHTCLLPHDLLAQHDLSPEAFIHDPASTPARNALADTARLGQALLRQAIQGSQASEGNNGPALNRASQVSEAVPLDQASQAASSAHAEPGGASDNSKPPGQASQPRRASRPARFPKSAIAAILPAVLARRDFARWPAVAVPRRLGDRLAVLFAATTGRL